MWFKILLSTIFRRDFTVTATTPEQKAEIEEYMKNNPQPQSWTSDCGWGEQLTLNAYGGVHLCCDQTRSYLSCSQRRVACSGHYGVCCSKC